MHKIVLYYFVYFGLLVTFFDGAWKYVLGIIPLALSAVMVKVCIERINEIKEGEELGADSVVNIHYASSAIMENAYSIYPNQDENYEIVFDDYIAYQVRNESF